MRDHDPANADAIAGRKFYLLADDANPRILHLGLECAGCGDIVAVCSYDGSGVLEMVTETVARHLIRLARAHACALLLVVLTVVTVGCGDDPRGTPPEWRMTSTLPGQNLGQTGTPKLYPTTTVP